MNDVAPAITQARASPRAIRPGRPRTVPEPQRRAMLIDAAEAVFLDRGYHVATMDDVAQRAGMSKKTVYQVFASKAGLFEALLVDRLRMLTLPFEEDGLAPEESLVALMVRLAHFILSPQQLALLRLMVAEGPRSPDMVEALKRQEIGRGRGPLERWFAHRMKQGVIGPCDPQEMASIMFGMVLSEMWCSALLNTAPPPPEAEIIARARRFTRIGLALVPPS